MSQSVPIDAALGVARTGQAIGCIVYALDGTTVFTAFSVTGWYEAPAASGSFHHAGISLPDVGGVVAVGVSGTEYTRVSIEAAKALASDYTPARAVKLDYLDVAITSRSSHSAADVWVATTRTLSAAGVQAIWDALTSALTTSGSIGKWILDKLDAAITSRMATFVYTAPTTPPTAAAIRTEIDTNSTQLAKLGAPVGASISADIAGVQADTNDLRAQIGTAGAGLTAIPGVLPALLEGSITVVQALRIMLSVLSGKSSGGGTTTIAFRDMADTKDRVSATVDASGNRSAVTRDGS